MKFQRLLAGGLLSAALSLSSAGFAQNAPPPGPQGPQGGPPPSGADFIKKFDSNGDGKISVDEYVADFAKMDASHDGLIDATEAPQGGGDFIGGFDANGDGKVSKDEFLADFRQMDKNGDGFVELSEAPGPPPPPGTPPPPGN